MRIATIIILISMAILSPPVLAGISLVQELSGPVSEGSAFFGHSVSDAGDVNGDGIDDVIVGEIGYGNYTGRAHVFLGGSSMDSSADVVMTGEGLDNFFGCSVSGIGDFNNDGYADIAVGAYGYGVNTGRVYVYFGGPAMDGAAELVITGEAAGNRFGFSVSGAGDVNADGYDDLIVGACGYDSFTGRAYVYFGGPSMDDAADVIMTGEAAGDVFGTSISDAGDVNNDGYDDVIVGASANSFDAGRVYVYFGGDSTDDTADVVMTGAGIDRNFGCSVSGAGDVNRDGFDDVIVGETNYNAWKGHVYVYYGGDSMDSVADVTITGEGAYDYFGRCVSGAGDVNNDRYDDMIVGTSQNPAGNAYVYFGGSSMDDESDVTLTGGENDKYFGDAVSDAGDVNGDSICEILVGAPLTSTYGKSYVYSISDLHVITPNGGESWQAGSIQNVTWTSSMTSGTVRIEYSTDNGANWSDVTADTEDDGLFLWTLPDTISEASLIRISDTDGSPADTSDSVFTISQKRIFTRLKIYLEGPYLSGGSMRTAESIPLKTPYADSINVKSVPDGMTDWISVEICSLATGPVLRQKSFFVNLNGSVVDTNGTTVELGMPNLDPGEYYLIVRHRNHLAVMSASRQTLGTGSPETYDFTTGIGRYYGSNPAKQVESGVYGLWAGDVNQDGNVTTTDYTSWYNSARLGESGYKATDINMDGVVTTTDYTMWYNNARLGAASQVP